MLGHIDRLQEEKGATVLAYDSDKNPTIAVNHSASMQSLQLNCDGYCLEKVYYGDIEKVSAFDACVFKFKKEK